MTVIYILLLAAGVLPMVVFLVKRKRYRIILQTGVRISAAVTAVRTINYHRGGTYDRVTFAYLPAGSVQYFSGQFIVKTGKHKPGDVLDVFYLPGKPQENAVPGSKGDVLMFLFMVLIFLFVLFACFKINEMLGSDTVTYEFKPPWKK